MNNKSLCLLLLVMMFMVIGCNADILYKNALKAEKNGDYEKAINKYKTLITIYPKDSLSVKARLNIADIYLEEKDSHSFALAEYRKIIKNNSLSREAGIAQKKIADIYLYKTKDYEKAREGYKTLVINYKDSMYVAKAKEEIQKIDRLLSN